jgi:hypothetical protein
VDATRTDLIRHERPLRGLLSAGIDGWIASALALLVVFSTLLAYLVLPLFWTH